MIQTVRIVEIKRPFCLILQTFPCFGGKHAWHKKKKSNRLDKENGSFTLAQAIRIANPTVCSLGLLLHNLKFKRKQLSMACRQKHYRNFVFTLHVLSRCLTYLTGLVLKVCYVIANLSPRFLIGNQKEIVISSLNYISTVKFKLKLNLIIFRRLSTCHVKTEIESALQTVWKIQLKGSYLNMYFINLGIRNILASLLFYFDLGKVGEGRGACCNLHSNINICQVKRERGNRARHRPWQSAAPPAHADVPKPALNQQEGTEECKHQAPQQQPHCCPCCQSSAEDAALVVAGNCTAWGWAGVCSPASTRGCEEHKLCFNACTESVRMSAVEG